jgi:hypothetical protein
VIDKRTVASAPFRHTHLVNYALYQVGWFACVLGGAWQRPWSGFWLAVIMLGAHFTLSHERALEGRLVLLVTAVGAIVEMLQIATGTYRFTSGTVVDALPPPWLLAMWAQFATTFRFSLHPVLARPMRAVGFGAVGGPIAFLAGERLGAITLLPPLGWGLVRLSISWAIALVIFSAVVRRVAPESGAKYVRMRREISMEKR